MKIRTIRITAFIITLMLILTIYACGGNEQKISPDTVTAGADSGGQKSSADAAVTDAMGGSEQQKPAETTAGDSIDTSIDGADEGSPAVSPEIETSPPVDEPSGEPAEAPGGGEEMTTADSIVALAQSLIGAEYEWGAAGPDKFDNSGFVYYCFKENGITLPRKTSEMFASGTPVEREDLLPGDLVFFTYNEDRSASYVGIYLGDGRFIAENNEDRPVSIHDMTLDYYTKIYVGARRYF